MRQQGIVTGLVTIADKKTAPFQGRGQSNREEVTPKPRCRAFGKISSGIERLTMYFGAERQDLRGLQSKIEGGVS